MKLKLHVTLLFIAALFVATTSRATLIGDTIDATGTLLSPGSATIGSGVEFLGIDGFLGLDFGASTLTLASSSGLLSFQGLGLYTFSGFDDTITGISTASNGGWTGSVLTPLFDAHSITLDMSDSSLVSGAQLVFNIQTSSRVPDHGGTIALFGMALVGLVVARRKSPRVGA
jgi:hypothetical protein